MKKLQLVNVSTGLKDQLNKAREQTSALDIVNEMYTWVESLVEQHNTLVKDYKKLLIDFKGHQEEVGMNFEKQAYKIECNTEKLTKAAEWGRDVDYDLIDIKSKTDTLEFNNRSNELKNYMHSRVFNAANIEKDTLEYTLFFRKLNMSLQASVKKKYGISRYGLLLLDELEECKEFIDSWTPRRNFKRVYMDEYRKRYDKRDLSCSLKEAYSNYLVECGGVL